MRFSAVALGLAAALLAVTARAAEWTPSAWSAENTVELKTTDPGAGPHWFPVWLAVVDDALYVRLGSRAAGRFERSTTKPVMGVRIAGNEFDRVRGVEAPDMAERVAAALHEKYWTDVLVQYWDHPLTLRLEPVTGDGG